MIVRAALVAILVPTLFTSCTSYHPETFTGGYSEMPLSANAFRVETRGNAYATPARVREITLVRGAVLTLDNGFQRFVVLDQENWEKVQTTYLPGTYQGNTTIYGSAIGGNVYGTGTTFGTYTPPQRIQHSKPRTAMVVYMLREGEPGFDQALDPYQIIGIYGPRVGYDGPYLNG